ncbi:restriction endonuclease [Salipaludibacillus aurantiacus]|uniref:Restriction endonuclease n=1 Tax=Salipaludibacillus aurantiacus TaxID=1601833 RepID=A0A1H9Q3F3_9BACI|nr:restriction endonuclease [Salipaludibacillus aurantiacus]SER54403.1 Restriction endonuclease [Salipaludibacillus aurantiacus]
MANVSFNEKIYFERIFQMENGYVLDFTNRTFQDFILDTINIDIYHRYDYESKAKLLRRVISDFDNVTVGKLLMELLDYKRLHLDISNDEKETFYKCVDIANRLMGKSVRAKLAPVEKHSNNDFDFKRNLEALIKVSKLNNSQERGYTFEKYLYDFFKSNQLSPRESFKLIGEQIDGSFSFKNEIYLLEAKWTKKLVDKGELVKFNEKVSSKSRFTRGFFISFSGYSEEALATFNSGRSVNIVLMTVQELVISLEREIDFNIVLEKKIRALAEEGKFYKNIIELF